MSETPSFLPRLFAEMKRRRVFRVMAVYGIVGFVILQVVDLAVPALLLPDWTYRLVALILLVGFPVAIVLAWAFEQTPDGLKRTERADPAEIEAIVAQPAARRWTPGLLALAGIVLLFGGWWMGRQTAPDTDEAADATNAEARLALSDPDDDARASIAVLPFADMSPDGDQEYFSDGMTDEIMNVLVKVDQFRVPARTSAFTYKKQEKDARQIGSELGVGYLVEGSVRKAGDMLRITAQLIDAETDEHLWSETYDRELTAANVFDIQTEIAMAIAEALTVPLGLDDASDLVKPTGDLEAYDLYLAGREQMRRRAGAGESLVEATRLFEAAIVRDSNFAPAWAALAEAKELSVWWRATYDSVANPADRAALAARTLEESERAATRALELDPRNPSAIVALASVHRDRGQWSEGEKLYLRALEIDPDNAEAHQQYGELLGNVGRIAEAVRSTDRAAVLDPAPIRLFQVGFSLELDDRLEEAADVYRLAMERDPAAGHTANWRRGYRVLARLGNIEEARRVAMIRDTAISESPWPAVRWDSAISALAEANFELVPDGNWLDRDRRLGLPADFLVAMGRPEDAVTEYLENTWYSNRRLKQPREVWLPGLDSIRSDPRIQAYMDSVGIADAVLQRTPVEERTRPMILERR